MYNVFVNDTPIIITSSLKKENDYPVYLFKEIIFDEIIYKLKHNSIRGITLYSSDLEEDWQTFLQNLKVVPAAGGLVLNAKKEVLFIFRNNVWDLPKGKIEKGETIETAAIREVEEECAIFDLSIIKKLLTTYHIYHENGVKLKETHWFLMHSNYNKKLIPQIEEGITEVLFKNKAETDQALLNTYANIKLVYDTFQEQPFS
ncbi:MULTISPECIES: NUDIX hydrolase [unclassified Polaribacter]|uniref:NUDIX hydrolase n=1 Tax=unclassified Polaribacter TaxID=196858 RepID=UPI0011BE01B3|nr:MULTISPECIES: NUDIX domain-containing protein [unclassified Polaribacter]TXD54414.1 NUDIX domain-containing protein [Polaribacter sp. IC063]TXD60327.1 NUDIX domain-containing protein [Polaribacter sp. IC066]